MTRAAPLIERGPSDSRPFVSADEAFAFLGIDRTTGYRAIHMNTFPVPVIRVGRLYRVPMAPLRRLLGDTDVVERAETLRYAESPTTDCPATAGTARVGSRSERTRSHSAAVRRVTRKGAE